MSLGEFLFGFSDHTKARHPHLFTRLNIDRRKCHRVVPMKVLCLSMGRTGTASMKIALEQLGYPTSHGFDLHENVSDADLWMEAINAKWYGDKSVQLNSEFWDPLLGHVSAVTDVPANMFGPELIAAYPDAKVIVVERDVDKWYTSFNDALITPNEHPVITSVFGQLDPVIKKLAPIVSRGMMGGQFRAKDATEWRQNAKPMYTEHYAALRRLLKGQPDRLLDFKLEEGWEPLCAFLGQPIPNVEFPRVNESAQHDDLIRVVMVQTFRSIVSKLLVLGSVVLLVVVVLRKL